MSGALAASLLFGAVVLAGCSRPGGSEADVRRGPPDVLLITLDTFRADRAGCQGHPGGLTPAIDRILRQGLLARHAYAPAPITAISHASLLTGLEPPNHGVRENGRFPFSEEIPSLAPLLRERGFRTAAFIAAFPLERRFGFAHGFDSFDDDIEQPSEGATYYAERPADAVVDAALTWAREQPARDRWLAWTHFFDPHNPRSFPEPLGKLNVREDYDREVRSMDLEIGRLMRGLEAIAGRKPLTVVASDHGEALGGHGELSHGILLYEETMRALVGIYAPEGAARSRLAEVGGRAAEERPGGGWIHDGIVRHTDLLPTLFDLLEIELPVPVDGRSLLDRSQSVAGAYGETYSPSYSYGWSPLLSWRDERWTYIEGPEPELYDRTRIHSKRETS